jgi:2-hydroxy-6-oxonona-2,4-dienedioate hydrolase
LSIVNAPTQNLVEVLPGRLVQAGKHELWVIETGSGKPLVFLHGGGPGCTAWTDFAPVLPAFADRHVVMVDLLLYGRSSAVKIEGPRWSYQADHVALALKELGIEKADFVCSSIGGAVALAIAARHQELVGKIVLSGSIPTQQDARPPTPELGKEGSTAWGNYYGGDGPSWEKSRHIMARLEWYDESRIPDSTVDQRYQNSLLDGPRLVGADWNNTGTPEDLGPVLPAIKSRVLFLWGLYDPFLVPEYALSLARTVPHGDVYVMDKASHHMEEEYPEDYSRVVRAFLAGPDEID